MAKRLHGLAIVTTALAPLILLVVVGIATWVAVGSVRTAVADYSETVSTEVGKATKVFVDVGTALDDVGAFVAGIATDVQTAVAGLGPISPDVKLPTRAIGIPRIVLIDDPIGNNDVVFPAFTVLEANSLDFTIPGIEPVGQFLVDLGDSADAVSNDIERQLAGLIVMPEPIDTVRQSTADLGAHIGSTLRTWLVVVAVALAAVVAAWASTRMGTALAEVSRGWGMLMGRDGGVSVEDLRAQLTAIERALAQLA